MRVLVVSHLFPNSAGPDHGIWLYRLVRGCRRLGVDARVINADRIPGELRGPARWLAFMGELRGHFAQRRQVFEDVPSTHPSHIDSGRLPDALKHLPRAMVVHAALGQLERSGFQPELVHAVTSYNSGSAAFPLARRLSVPLVVTEISSPYTLETSPPYRARKARAVLRASARIACTSVFMASQVSATFPETSSRLRTVYFPTDDRFFDASPARREGGPLRLISVCILNEQKGLRIMLEALEQLRAAERQFEWTLVGDGPLRAELESRVGALGLADRVRILGQIDNARVRVLLERAHAFVLPSLHETQAVALVEALSAGLPAVYTRCGGPEEFMTTDDGISVEPGSAPALAEAIERLDREYHRFSTTSIKERCRRRFGEQACARSMLTVYEEARRERLRA
jgi:glycosyltransferase involved in cell wall biosynthesis